MVRVKRASEGKEGAGSVEGAAAWRESAYAPLRGMTTVTRAMRCEGACAGMYPTCV
jgi:hypothetical protein